MTTAVIMSDVHGNLPALEAVIASLPAYDVAVVAGDLCLEGPCPAEVLDVLRETGWRLLRGNTDRDVVDQPADLTARKAELVTWTRSRLGEARIGFLGSLPFSQHVQAEGGHSALVVHANPLDLHTQLQPTMSEEELRPYLAPVDAGLLAFGHLHIPYVRPVDHVLLVDVASVGHPKDRDPRAAYTEVTWEAGCRRVTQVRVPYDVERAVELIRRSGMPHAQEEAADLLRAAY